MKKGFTQHDYRMNRVGNNHAGFTLVELLLYMVILSTMLGVLTSFVVMTYKVRVKSQVVAEVEQQGNQTMDIITQAVRNSSAINLPVAQASGATLTINSSTTTFDMNANKIRMNDGVAYDIVSNKVAASGLLFTNVTETGGPGSVRIQFTLTYNNISGTNEYDYAKTFYATASRR